MLAKPLNRISLVASKPNVQLRSISSFWKDVPMGPKDPILGVSDAFKADTNPIKVNVGVGAYRTDEGKPWVLPSVKEAERRNLEAGLDHEYSAIDGVADFVKGSINLAYGKDSEVVKSKRVAALQALSGTGALRLAGQFLAMHGKANHGKPPKVFMPDPTWGNHFTIFQHAGLETGTYRYWDKKTLGLDLTGLLEDLKNAPAGSAVVLHSCAHNPTGVDPTLDQWKQISDVCKAKGHFPIFDNAYQGFATGDTTKDIAAVRMFVKEGHNPALCQSFAKNFGLYGERIGTFSIVCENQEESDRVLSQLKIIARAIYSNPPIHGARIIATILGDDKLKSMWDDEIKVMSGRIIEMRKALRDELKAAGSKKDWSHITNQIGMFSYTGLTPEQCDFMTKNYHIYLTRNGRISMAGVTTKNVKHLAKAIHEASLV